MQLDKSYIHGILAKAIDDRDKLIHNNKDVINEKYLKLWKSGSLDTHELVYKIDSSAVREAFMYLTIVINEMEEKVKKENNSRIQYSYSC